jgi:hypothetical protein
VIISQVPALRDKIKLIWTTTKNVFAPMNVIVSAMIALAIVARSKLPTTIWIREPTLNS